MYIYIKRRQHMYIYICNTGSECKASKCWLKDDKMTY